MENPSETKPIKAYSKYAIQYGVLLVVMCWGMVNTVQATYWQYFMTNVALISTTTVAFVLLVGTTFDMFAVPISGIMMEKIRLPWGKYPSWLIVGPIIVVVLFIFMFIKYPFSEAIAATCAASAYCLACLGINTMVTSCNMAVALGSNDPKERAVLATKKGQGSALNGLVFGVIGLPIIRFFNGDAGGPKGQDAAIGYIALIIILGILLFGACFFLFVHLRKKLNYDMELGVDKQAELDAAEAKKLAEKKLDDKPSLWVMLKMVFTNLPLLSIIVTDGLRYIGRASMLGMLPYFFKYVIGDPGGTSMFLAMSGAVALGGAIFTEIIAHKFQKKMIYLTGYCTMLVCYLLMFFFANSAMTFTVFGAIWYLGLALVNSTQVGMYSDAVDFGVHKEKKDCRAWLMAIAGFPPKFGNWGRSLVTGFGLVAIGFSATAEMTPAVLDGLRMLMTLLPAGIFAVGIVILIFGFRLNDAKMKTIQADLLEMGLGGKKK